MSKLTDILKSSLESKKNSSVGNKTKKNAESGQVKAPKSPGAAGKPVRKASGRGR